MTNINVRVVGTANVSQMKGAFAGLEAQVGAINSQLARMVALQNGVDPAGYNRAARAAQQASATFRSAAASTGMFNVEQLRLNDATDDYVKRLNKQRISFRQMWKERATAAAAYKKQLAMENAMLTQWPGQGGRGRPVVDFVVPKHVSADLDTAGRKLAWFNAQVKSGAEQMVNWGKNTQWAGRQLMVGFTMPVAAFGAAAGIMAYKVDKELTRIQKVYDTTADINSASIDQQIAAQKELDAVREASMNTAIQAAKAYGAAGTDTLNVQAELAATGQRGAALQQATNEVMRISMLGELEYQDAIQSTISLQSVFNLSTRELTDAFNYMNAVENATSLQTKDFAQAIPIAAAPVKAFGGDIKELGILLTAMKERGIEATQGANAIKAAMQRLGRPSKQIQEEWTALTGTDITKIFEQATSLTDLFSQIGDATDELSNKEKIKAFAGLFGTYQVTRMTALVEGMDDLAAGTGQVSAAAEAAGMSYEELANIAEREGDRIANSVSGKWDRAVQEMLLQISTMGTPFVEAATVVVKAISGIIKWFNGLPDAAKKIIAAGAVLAALAGPVIMLTGLLGNLVGMTLKGVSALVSLGTSMKILDKEGRAAAMQAQLVEAGFIDQASAAQMLTAEIHELTAAYRSAIAAQQGIGTGGLTAAAAYQAPVVDKWGRTIKGGTPLHVGAQPAGTPGLALQPGHVKAAEDVANSTQKTSKFARMAAGSTAAMAAGMLLTFTNSNKTANSLGNWLIVGSMVVPAAVQLAGLMKIIALRGKAYAESMKVAAAASYANKGGAKGIWGSLGTGGKSLLGRVATAGTAATAIVAGIGYTLNKMHNDHVESQREATRIQQNVNRLAETWAESVGKARRDWEGIVVAQRNSISMSKQAELNAAYGEGDLGERAKSYEELDTDARYLAAKQHFIDLQAQYNLSEKQAAAHVRALMYNAGESLATQDMIVQQLMDDIGTFTQNDFAEYFQNQMDIMNNMDVNTEQWHQAGKDALDVFVLGFNRNMTPDQADQMVGQLTTMVDQAWKDAITPLWQDPYLKDSMEKAGYASIEALRKGVKDAGGVDEFVEGLRAKDIVSGGQASALRDSLNFAIQAESEFVGHVAKSNSLLGQVLDDGINSLDEFANHWAVKTQSMSFSEVQDEVKNLGRTMLTLPGMFGPVEEMAIRMNPDMSNMEKMNTLFKQLKDADPEKATEFAIAIESIAKARGIKIDANNPIKTYFNILRSIRNETNNVENATKAWGRAVSYTASEMAQIRQSAMQGVQQDIADGIRENFDERMNNAIEARQKYWDGRKEALQNEFDRQQQSQSDRHERESQAMEDRHSRQSLALDRKWERRTDQAEKYWDKRIEGVEKAIKAEQKAEEIRQRMFEAEIARINRLNDMANRNIDFNVALNEGNLDEAAKIRNDAQAQQATWTLEDAADAGSRRSERRIDTLESRQDHLEKARDKHMEHLQKMEEAERRSLERRQEREKRSLQKRQEQEARALEKRQKMRQKALDAEAEADLETQQKIWEQRKKSLEQQLELFLSFIARNEKELKKHMKNVGLSYHNFGEKVLKPKGENWSKFFGDRMQYHIRKAGNQLKSDKMWEQLGKGSAKRMLKGIGFNSWKQFSNFLDSGNLPKNFGKTGGGDGGGGGSHNNGDGTPSQTELLKRKDLRHGGGWIGSRGRDSRKGVARTNPLHPSEVDLRARKGEFVVNEDAASRNASLLEQINRGEDADSGQIHGTPRYRGRGLKKGEMGGDKMAASAVVAGAVNSLLLKGINQGIQNVYARKQAELAAMAAVSGMFGAGKGGKYGDQFFSSEQLRNAAIIANAGRSLGMSARDIQIGIMTAITESGLRNVHYGHLDSLGLFQQRSSWGSADQRTNPEWAARAFFRPLKGHGERNSESPWLAAQHIQRSAFPTGSNYKVHWDEAQAIYKRGLTKNKDGNYSPATYGAGPGGWHKPVKRGHFSSSHDIPVPVGTPVYAVGDGKIVESRYITQGGSPGNGTIAPNGQRYRSYGETMVLQIGSARVRYAHLSRGSRRGTGKVSGGSQIARSGNTGNSSGPHLHMDINGAEIAQSWLAARGIRLSKGAANINYDNTPAILHKNEAVLTEDLNRKFTQGVQSFSQGPVNLYKEIMNSAPKNSSNNDGGGSGSGSGNGPGGSNTGGENTHSGAGGNVRVGTYNVAWRTGMGTTRPDVERLMKIADILGLQEVYKRRQSLVSKTFKQNGWGHSPIKHDNVIAWNKRIFESLRSGNQGLNPGMTGGGRNSVNRMAAFALLRNKKSGRKMWAVSTHLQPFANSSPRLRAIQDTQFRNLERMYNKMNQTAPVVMVGDFNRDLFKHPGSIPKGMKTSRRGGKDGLGGTHGKNNLDFVLMGKSIKAAGNSIIRKGMDSDHNALIANLKIPGMRDGGFTLNNGLAQLHEEELVIDRKRSKVLLDSIDNGTVATGAGNHYTVKVDASGTGATADEIVQKAVTAIQRLERRKPGARRN